MTLGEWIGNLIKSLRHWLGLDTVPVNRRLPPSSQAGVPQRQGESRESYVKRYLAEHYRRQMAEKKVTPNDPVMYLPEVGAPTSQKPRFVPAPKPANRQAPPKGYYYDPSGMIVKGEQQGPSPGTWITLTGQLVDTFGRIVKTLTPPKEVPYRDAPPNEVGEGGQYDVIDGRTAGKEMTGGPGSYGPNEMGRTGRKTIYNDDGSVKYSTDEAGNRTDGEYDDGAFGRTGQKTIYDGNGDILYIEDEEGNRTYADGTTYNADGSGEYGEGTQGSTGERTYQEEYNPFDENAEGGSYDVTDGMSGGIPMTQSEQEGDYSDWVDPWAEGGN